MSELREVPSPKKRYLGDGVFVDVDGHGLVLTTENGVEETNRIVLEPEVYDALLQYVFRLRAPRESL